MSHTLSVIRGEALPLRHDLGEDDIVIGRDPESDIVIEAHAVSRRHARLLFENNGYFIEDLNSRNGTYLTGRRVTGKARLKSGDHVAICDTVFLFRSSGPLASEIDEDLATSVLYSPDDSSSSETPVTASAEGRLQAILRINDALAGTLDFNRVVNNMLDQLFDIFPQTDCCLALLPRAGRLVPVAVKHRRRKEEGSQYIRAMVDKVVEDRRAALVEDVTQDRQYPVTATIQGLHMRSIMCAPLLSRAGEVLAVVQLDTRREKRKFTFDDIQILMSVAKQAAVSVEYLQLHREKIRHARLQRELDIARQVQYSLLPTAVPELEGYRFWAHYQAAGPIGGDFYDFLQLPNGSEAVVLGDVAGKGVPAALDMVRVCTLCKVALLRHPDKLAEAMNSLNREVYDAGREISLASLAVCVLDPTSHEVTITNAGHHSPVLRRNDGALDERVGDEVRGYMLGVQRESDYETGSTRLAPGEFVVLFSDGVSDAMNAGKERFTVERVRRHLMQTTTTEPAEVGETLLEGVRRHVAASEQHDDMALVVFRRNPT